MDDTTASVAQAPPVPKKRGRPKKVVAVDGSASAVATEGTKKVVGKTSAAVTKAKKTATPKKENDEVAKKVGKPAPVKRTTKVVKSRKDDSKVVAEKIVKVDEKVVVQQSKILEEVEKKGTLKAAVAGKTTLKTASSEPVSEAPLLEKAKASGASTVDPPMPVSEPVTRKIDVASQSKGLSQEPTPTPAPAMASAIESMSTPTASPVIKSTVPSSSKSVSKPQAPPPPPVASSSSSSSKSTPAPETAFAIKDTQNPAASPVIASVASASSKSTPNPQFSIPKLTSRPPPGTPSSPSKPPSPPSAPRQPPPPKPIQPHPRATTVSLPRNPHNPYLSRPAPLRPKPLTPEEIEKKEAEIALREGRLPKKYQQAGKHITRIMVGIPFIIVGGYILYQRSDLGDEVKELKNFNIAVLDRRPASSPPPSSSP